MGWQNRLAYCRVNLITLRITGKRLWQSIRQPLIVGPPGLTLGGGLVLVAVLLGQNVYDLAKCYHTDECERGAAKYESQDFPSWWWWDWNGSLVTSADTLAQWIMSFFTIAAVLLVWRTLVATQAALVVTRETGRDQSRAYVEVDSAIFYWGTESRAHPEIKIMIRNSGATPAKWYQVRQSYLIYDHSNPHPFGRDFDSLPLTGQFGEKWNGIPPRENGQTTAGPKIREDAEIEKCLRPKIELYRTTQTDNTHGIVVFGEIRYCTTFDEIYRSQFFFGRASLNPFESKEPVLIESQNRYGVVAKLMRTEEIPQKFSKFPINLDIYKPEGKD